MSSRYSISRYLNVRQAYLATFSSDSRRLAFLTDITGVPQVWQVALGKSLDRPPWPEQLTFESERVISAEFSPAPGDGRLLYARDVGGNENAQLFVLSADGASEASLTVGFEGAMHIPGRWSADGRRFLFAANRRDPALFDLYVQPLEGGTCLAWQNDQPGYLANAAFSPDGRRAIATRMSSSFHHDLLEIDLAAGAARRLSPADGDVRYVASHYVPDGRSLFLLTDLDSDTLYIARLDLESGALEPLVVPDWDIECMSLSPDGRYLAYAVNEQGAFRIQLRDLDSGKVWKSLHRVVVG